MQGPSTERGLVVRTFLNRVTALAADTGRKRGKSSAKKSSTKKNGAKKKSRTRRPASAKRPGKGPAKSRRRPSARSAGKPAQTKPAARQAPHPLIRTLAMLVAFAAMVGFAVVLSHLTLEPSQASVNLTHTNLQPGDSIRNYLRQPAFQDTVKQLGGNIVLGMPFGLLLPVLVPRARGLVRVTLVTAAVMLLVELVQGALITGRAFDIDDVILNASGAFLGYLLLGRRLGRAVHPRRRHWWHRLRGQESAAGSAG